MDKPVAMSVKEYLTRTMSIKNNIPLATIDAIVTHQFEEANKAMLTNNSVEIAGFGKFLFKVKKANKKMEKLCMKRDYYSSKLAEGELTEAKTSSYTLKLSNTIKEIEVLKAKLNGGIHKDNRGMEEQLNTPIGPQGDNSNEIRPTSEDMQGMS